MGLHGTDYLRSALLQIDIANFKAALAGVSVEEAFMPVAAPITVETDRRNEYYPSQEAYLYAIADALKQEYKASSTPGFWSNWTIHGLPRVGTNCCPTSICKNFRNFVKRGSKRPITRWRASREIASVTIYAGAAGMGRIARTSPSSTSSHYS